MTHQHVHIQVNLRSDKFRDRTMVPRREIHRKSQFSTAEVAFFRSLQIDPTLVIGTLNYSTTWILGEDFSICNNFFSNPVIKKFQFEVCVVT